MPYLVVENGNRRGFKVEIPSNGKVVFGRDARNEIAVTDHLCSRRHFEVTASADKFVIEDLGSSNGTYVNDQRTPNAVLEHGDCIQAGETQLTFLVETGEGARGLVGKTVGGYRILERIGRGGMGTVYKANQTSLNRTVALKILSPKIAKDPSFVKKFHKEAQAAGRLNHPNIVQVYDVGSESGLHFYSMEYIENGSVQDLATREGQVDPELALAIIIDAARGLEYAEKKGLVHRDIKPDNLMVNAEGVVKIADLGLARDAGHTARETDAAAGQHHEDDEGIFGTPHFIAPEQARGLDVDTRSDMYSLGASFYRLVTGETPFKGDSVREIVSKQINEDPTPVREKNREVPSSIAQVIEKMMRKDPDERHQSATALVEDLERIAAQLEGGSRKGLIATTAVAIAAIAVLVVVVMGNGNDEAPDPDPQPKTNGPTNPPDNPDDEVQQAYVAALKELNQYQLENARLVGTARTEAALTALVDQYETFVTKHESSKVWEKPDIAKAKADLTAIKTELDDMIKAREAREAAAAAKVKAADDKRDALLEAIDDARKQELWCHALRTSFTGTRAIELRDFPEHQAEVKGRKDIIVAEATDRTTQDRDAAKTALDEGRFADATRILNARLANLETDLDDDSRLDEIRALANLVKKDLRAVAVAEGAKAAADRAADQATGLKARRSAFELLRKSFDPDQALALLKLAEQDLKTEPWKDLIARDIELISSLQRMRDGFVQRMTAEPPNKDKVKLLSSTGTREIQYTLVKVDARGFEVKLGTRTYRHEYADFRPTDLHARLFTLRPDTSAEARIAEATMLLLEGLAAEARATLTQAGSARPELVSRLRREADAVALVVRIRNLEVTANSQELDYLKLLPLVNRFLKDYRDTIAFALNSDGSTPVFDK